MHDNIVPAAPETSANYLDIDAAVELIARRANPKLKIVYRDAADAAWRTLCKLAPAGARILSPDGLLRKPDPIQFEGFADKYWKFASVIRGTLPGEDTPCELAGLPGTYDVLDEHGVKHYGSRLMFLKGEIDAAWWATMEPKTRTERIAKWLRGKHSTRPDDHAILAKDMKDMAPDFGDIHRNILARAMKLAWPS